MLLLLQIESRIMQTSALRTALFRSAQALPRSFYGTMTILNLPFVSDSLGERQAAIYQSQCRLMATKKAAGSTANKKDNSPGNRLGIKKYHNEVCVAGNILVRQRGAKLRAGVNVGMGRDHTIFAKAHGIVKMTRSPRNKKRHDVHVIPESELEGYDQLMLDLGYVQPPHEPLKKKKKIFY